MKWLPLTKKIQPCDMQETTYFIELVTYMSYDVMVSGHILSLLLHFIYKMWE